MSTHQPLTATVATTRSYHEGPTRSQARKTAARRHALIAESQAATAAGNDELAFDLDCKAWDIEMALTEYGFTMNGTAKRR